MLVYNSVIFVYSNTKNLLNWSTQNKDLSLRIAIPTIITLSISRAIFNLSYLSSFILTALSFSATIIDQKNPNAKKLLFEKIKTVAKMIQEEYQKVKEKKYESLLEKEKRFFFEYSTFMLSCLELSQNQILKVYNTENSSFKITCKQLGLSDINILTLLNFYALYPKSFKKNEDDYEKRLEKFISLLPSNKRFPFQKKLEDCKKRKALAKTSKENHSTSNLFIFLSDQQESDSRHSERFQSSKDKVVAEPISSSSQILVSPKFALYYKHFKCQCLDTTSHNGKSEVLSPDQIEQSTLYVYENIILNQYYQSQIREIPGVTDEIAYTTMPFLNMSRKSGEVSITFPLKNRVHTLKLNKELKEAVKIFFAR